MRLRSIPHAATAIRESTITPHMTICLLYTSQIATSVCNMLFPKIKGTVTALVMIASSLCNYTILTAASKMQPSQVMVMNIVLTAIGVVLGLYVNLRYTKMVELSKED